ncbi:MAG: hypothetical protein ACI4UK_00090 [Floccifex sp.]
MRITEIDLQCEDIMWFGIDNENHIFECTSAGCGNVPEFVCRSKENTEILLEFFINELDEFTEAKLLVEYIDGNQLLNECVQLSRKGIYCFDIYEENERQYAKIVEPVEPLNYDKLPKKIKDIFANNRVEIDVMEERIISVKHAY